MAVLGGAGGGLIRSPEEQIQVGRFAAGPDSPPHHSRWPQPVAAGKTEGRSRSLGHRSESALSRRSPAVDRGGRLRLQRPAAAAGPGGSTGVQGPTGAAVHAETVGHLLADAFAPGDSGEVRVQQGEMPDPRVCAFIEIRRWDLRSKRPIAF